MSFFILWLNLTIGIIGPEPNKCIWIGTNDATLETHWVSSATGDALVYSNWYPGEPSGSPSNDEDCAVLGDFFAAGKWYDVRCNNE